MRACTRTAALALALTAATSSIGEAQYSQGMEVGTVVETSLDQGRFRQALPFDVPFYVQAPIDNDVAEVQGKYARRHDLTCEQAVSDEAIPTQPPLSDFLTLEPRVRVRPAAGAAPGVVAAAAAGAALQPPPARGSIPGWLGYASLFVNEMGVRVFELPVPALKPRKDYCFQFVLRKKADPATARAIVVEALDTQLRLVTDISTLALAREHDRFRQRVIEEIQKQLAEKQGQTPQYRLVLEVPARSFFDPNTPVTSVDVNYRTQFDQVAQAQANRSATAANFTASATAAATALGLLATDARTAMLIAALRANSTDPVVASRLTSLGSSLDIVGANPSALAFGMRDDVPDSLVDYRTTWNPAAVEARIKVLESRIAELAEFRQLARLLAADRTLRTLVGVEPAAAGVAANPNAMLPADLTAVSDRANTALLLLTAARGDVDLLRRQLIDRSAAIAAMADQVGSDLERLVRFRGNTTADWRTRATAYLSADVGLAYSKGIQSFFFYLGANIYLGPVNKKATLSLREDGLRSSIRKRLAVMFGIPLNPFDDSQQVTSLSDPRGIQLDGVIGARPVLFGAGLRLTELVRFTAGTVIFKVRDPNPLISDAQLRRSAFVSISVDWDLRSSFGALVGTRPSATP